MSPRSFFVANFGCRASQSEGAAVEQELLDGMAMPAESAFAADVVQAGIVGFSNDRVE